MVLAQLIESVSSYFYFDLIIILNNASFSSYVRSLCAVLSID